MPAHRLDYSQAPAAFAMLCAVWALDAPLQRTWWRALRHTQDPLVVGWRQKLWLYAERARVLVPRTVLAALGSPAEVIGVIERLVQDRCLTHREGNAVMEALLAQVQADGTWRLAQTVARRQRSSSSFRDAHA